MSQGKVYLVGAGPGDPGLLTVRGARLLATADVVVFDYLVNPQVLAHAPVHAETICLGRHGHGHILSQQEICDLLVRHARQGRRVVRLKGGDPIVFAHAAEEITALAHADIAYEIVPGITAALAVGSYTGIPLTHGESSSAVALVTAQERADKDAAPLDYRALAAFPGTLVFYMGVTTVDTWAARLIEAGKAADTPAAIVRRVSWPDQRSIPCTLGTLAAEIKVRHLRPPALFIVGAVAALASEHGWFADRPLSGQRVLVTRAADQAAELAQPLADLGAEVLLQPAIEIGPPADPGPLDRAIAELAKFDWLVFASPNGVRSFIARLLESRDLRALATVQLAAVGSGTADALAEFHLRADVVPREHRAEALAEARVSEARARRRFLLIRASRGRETLPEMLAAAGGQVQQVVAYESRDTTAADPAIAEQLAAGQIDWITVTSSAIAASLVSLFGEGLKRSRLASISPVTSATLRELGYPPAVEAATYTTLGLVEAITQASDRPRS